MVIHASFTSDFTERPYCGSSDGRETSNLLGEEHCRGKVMSQTESLGHAIIPVKILSVYVKDVAARQGLGGRVKNVKGLINQLAQFAKAPVNRPNMRRLLTGLPEGHT